MTVAPHHRPERMFAGYRLGQVLGQGAMGQVFEAQDPSLGRRVALKLLGKSGASSADRFQREGELAARLEHPGIVRVHAAGSADGQSYIVYELVLGARPLDEAWAGVGLRQRVTWIRDVARALGYAHSQGVVHRDVKPENILVDQAGAVRITDFGVAGATDLERLTQTGALVGTPTHMAPEQMTGQGRPGPATDVWALGVVLYQALCDELPFEGHDWLTLATRITGGYFRPPSDSGSDVPAQLERLCQAALLTEPSARPATGQAFAGLLDDWLEGRGSRGRQGRGLRLGVAALLLVVLVGLAAAVQQSGPSPTLGPAETSSLSQSTSPAASVGEAGQTLPSVSNRLRKALVGPERLAAYRAARDWLETCDDPSERRLLVQRLALMTREPLARLRFELPKGDSQAMIRPYAWGNRILIGAKGSACLLDPYRAEISAPWAPCHSLSFAAVSPRRGLAGRGEVVRVGGGFHFSRVREDFQTPPTALTAQALGPRGNYFVAGRSSLAWGTEQSLGGTFPLNFPAKLLSISSNGQLLAVGCALQLGEGSGVDYRVELRVYTLGEHPVLVFQRDLVSRIRALTWIDDETLGVGQLVGNVLFLDVPTKQLRLEVGPPSANGPLLPLGGVVQVVAGQDTILAVCRNGLLGWQAGAADRGPVEVLRLPWRGVRRSQRVYTSVAHEGILWLLTKEGEVSAYSGRLADYALEARR